ncbi:Tapetum-specific protein A9 [Cardamine amara subsp. amara]|uniref:Tapetum-specific protein A9 n=1 Tax=Cardamine amara subsp. amara TaxID=228776 RepID=A0ABD0ZQD1_CARAN
MEALKSLAAILIVMFLAIGVRAQECRDDLSNMQVCAPLVLPGAVNPAPNSNCCVALQSTNKDCLCNALRAATTLTSLCNLPSFDCGISA